MAHLHQVKRKSGSGASDARSFGAKVKGARSLLTTGGHRRIDLGNSPTPIATGNSKQSEGQVSHEMQ